MNVVMKLSGWHLGLISVKFHKVLYRLFDYIYTWNHTTNTTKPRRYFYFKNTTEPTVGALWFHYFFINLFKETDDFKNDGSVVIWKEKIQI